MGHDFLVSIIHWRTGLLSLGPHFVATDTWLMARTHRFWTALSLFSYERVLRVDATSRLIALRERRGWRTRWTQLSIDEVDHIAYGYHSITTDLSTTSRNGRLGIDTADQVDNYSIELVLKVGDPVPLFSFIGEGATMSGVLGVLMGDSLIDFEGKQDEESRVFVRQLMRVTGLGLGPSLPQELADRRGTRCPRCNQLNVPRTSCLYCGAELAAATPPAAPAP